MSKNRKNTTKLVLLGYILLLVISLSLEPNESFIYFRGIRVLISFLFVPLILLRLLPKNKNVLGFCVCYSLASALSVFFEISVVAVLSQVVNGISFVFLSRLILSRIERKPMSLTFIVSLIVTVIINIVLLYFFLEVIFKHLQSVSLLIAICVSIASSFTLSVLAFIYNNESNSEASIFFVFFMIFLVFSETFRGAGYYGFVDPAYGQYTARFLLVISFILLYLFTNLKVEENKL